MKFRKVVVTGGCGFLGSSVVDALINKNFLVYVLDDLSSGSLDNLNPKSNFYCVNLAEKEITYKILKQIKPNYIIHLAAKINPGIKYEIPLNDVENQIVSSINLLEYSRNNNIKKFIFGSSVAVYGKIKENKTATEFQDLTPISSYGICKKTIENYLEYYRINYNLKYCSLRYSNIFGLKQKRVGEVGVIAIFKENYENNQYSLVFGDGKQTRDLIHVDEATNHTLSFLVNNNQGNYNIGSGKETRIIDVIKYMQEKLNYNKFKFLPKKKNDIDRFVCCMKKTNKVLKSISNFNLVKDLDKTFHR